MRALPHVWGRSSQLGGDHAIIVTGSSVACPDVLFVARRCRRWLNPPVPLCPAEWTRQPGCSGPITVGMCRLTDLISYPRTAIFDAASGTCVQWDLRNGTCLNQGDTGVFDNVGACNATCSRGDQTASKLVFAELFAVSKRNGSHNHVAVKDSA